MVWDRLIILALTILAFFQDSINALFQSDKKVGGQEEIEVIVDDETLTKVQVGDKGNLTDEAQRQELESLLAEIPDELALESPNEVAPQQAKATSSSSARVLDAEWAMKQTATNYTFQLMGSWERKEVEEFINTHALTGDVAVFESMRNGRVWFALIYGSFINKKAALNASQQWPAPLNTLPSWLRRFDSVHKQIKDNAVIE